MTRKIIRMIIGSREYRVGGEYTDRAADIITKSGANVQRLRIYGDELRFTLPLTDCRAVENILTNNGIAFELHRERGLAGLVKRYRRRIGIPIGAVLFFVILWLSEQFIWTVNVAGNEKIPSEVIAERLESMGCGVGTYIPGIDFDSLHNRFLIEYDDIAWVSVNVRGTDAEVEVLETRFPTGQPDNGTPYNLVASEDGVIEYMEILRGTPVAREKDLVREGELLASGIEEGKHSLRLVHSKGTVLAKVRRTVHVEVPFESTRSEPTGNVYTEKYFNIFGTSVKFFANTGNMSTEYDKIEYKVSKKRNYLNFFGAVEVPVAIEEIIYEEYGSVPVTYSETEARDEAYRRFYAECAAVCADAELASRQLDAGVRGDAYVIDCELTVIKNIAREAPIYTGDTGENQYTGE